jgi:hypothetical protein
MVSLVGLAGPQLLSAMAILAALLRAAKKPWENTLTGLFLVGTRLYSEMTHAELQKLAAGMQLPADTTKLARRRRKTKANKSSASETAESKLGTSQSQSISVNYDKLTFADMYTQNWHEGLHSLLMCTLLATGMAVASGTYRCFKDEPKPDFASLALLGNTGVAIYCLLGFISRVGWKKAESRMLMKLGVLVYVIVAAAIAFISEEYLELDVATATHTLAIGFHEWLKSVEGLAPDIKANLDKAPNTQGLVMVTSILVMPGFAACWTMAVFFPAVRFGRLYEHIMDTKRYEVDSHWTRRALHWLNFYIPLFAGMAWIPLLSRYIFVSWLEWAGDDSFNRIRLLMVMVGGVLRFALLSDYVQKLVIRSVQMLEEASTMRHVSVIEYNNRIIEVRGFVCGIALQYAAPAAVLLCTSMLLWRRTHTSLGGCETLHTYISGFDMRSGAGSPQYIVLSEDAAASLVGFLCWWSHCAWFICTVAGRILGPDAIVPDAS